MVQDLSYTSLFSGAIFSRIVPSRQIQQIVLVTTNSWMSQVGTLHMFSRDENRWFAEGKGVSVTIGKNGLGWGNGIHRAINTPPQKVEGDHRAPAGVFTLGPTFGYDADPPLGVSIPYRCITERDYYIDDPESEDYNQWVTLGGTQANEPQKLWNSFERMKRPDHLYELGLVVQHNAAPAMRDRGSAIFLHIWRAPGVPTVGCTAMAMNDLLTLIRWLELANMPHLIQAPIDEIGHLTMEEDADGNTNKG